MTERLRINFVLPPAPVISGGPLAILEYANRLVERGHMVTITTYPSSNWSTETPFPWFEFNGKILYVDDRRAQGAALVRLRQKISSKLLSLKIPEWAKQFYRRLESRALWDAYYAGRKKPPIALPFEWMVWDSRIWLGVIEATPECDINIATYWSTAFPVYYSCKGKPVYFMQHYEEVFFNMSMPTMLLKLMARTSYELPIYKIANSSWLQKMIQERYGQKVPFSNNGLELADFSPEPKKSMQDGIIRIVTYSKPEVWKGFPDAVAAMQKIFASYGKRVEWHVFGYQRTDLPENNPHGRYTYHPRLSFKELAALYATSDIALCPSWYESFPLPPLEAMASGTAVVTTAYGTEEYAHHEQTALVVGSRDIEAMAAAISRLIEDTELRNRLAAAGRKMAESYDWEHAVEVREKMLLDIHHGRVDYDILHAAQFSVSDEQGVPFELGAADLNGGKPGIFTLQGDSWFYYKGMRRHIGHSELIAELERLGFERITPSELDFIRMPKGPPVTTVDGLSNVPEKLGRDAAA